MVNKLCIIKIKTSHTEEVKVKMAGMNVKNEIILTIDTFDHKQFANVNE